MPKASFLVCLLAVSCLGLLGTGCPGKVKTDARNFSVARAIPGTIEAEDYAAGGEGVGYHDITLENLGHAYRNEGVDVQSEKGGGFNVGWIEAGEWLGYSVEVADGGIFNVQARVALAGAPDQQVHLVVDGEEGPATSFRLEGGPQDWNTVALTPVALTAGAHTLRWVFDTSGLNLDAFEFAAAPIGTPGVFTIAPANLGGAAGRTTHLTYRFVGGPTREPEDVLIRVIDDAGVTVFSDDHSPPTPSTRWTGNTQYERDLAIPEGLPSGAYSVIAGLTSALDGGTRLPLTPGPGVIAHSGSDSEFQIGRLFVGLLARDFGAKGDGTTDDTLALQTAFDASVDQTLVLETGNYLTQTLVLTAPVRIYGYGATLQAIEGTDTLLKVKASVDVSGLALDGRDQKRQGVIVYGASDVHFRDCELTGFHDVAFNVTKASGFSIEHCHFHDNGFDSVLVLSSNNGALDANTIENSGRDGIQWWGGNAQTPVGDPEVEKLTITKNHVTNSRRGGIWGSMGHNILATDNVIDRCGDVCLDMEGGSKATFARNQVSNGKNGGITCFHGTHDVHITKNTVTQSAGYLSAIMFYGTLPSYDVTVDQNTLTTFGSHGISSAGSQTPRDSLISKNVISLHDAGTAIKLPADHNITISGNVVSGP